MKPFFLFTLSLLLLGCNIPSIENPFGAEKNKTENTETVPSEITDPAAVVPETEVVLKAEYETEWLTSEDNPAPGEDEWVITGVGQPQPIIPGAKIMPAKFSEKTYQLTLADNNQAREKGLMNIQSMPADQGMLFVFDDLKKYKFWMKNTLIPLDIIWLNERREVVDFLTAEPCTKTNCDQFSPIAPAKYVIELNAGEFKGYIGDRVEF